MSVVDRRTFVKAAGVTCAIAPGLGAMQASAQSREPRKYLKALKWGMIGEGASVLEKFIAARDAGFDGIEMDSPSPLDLDEVISAQRETGLVIPGVVDSVHWRDTLSHPSEDVRAKGRAGLETAIRDCKRLGGTSVLLVPAVVNKQVSYAEAYARSQAEIRKVLPLAAELDIQILMENVWNNFLLSPLEAARYTDELESDHVGWHFDIGNIVNYGWPEHWIETLSSRIKKLDIKEYSRQKRNDEGLWKGFNVKLLEGDCDWPNVMKALDAIGYKGWMAAEVGGGDAARLREIATRMDRIIAS